MTAAQKKDGEPDAPVAGATEHKVVVLGADRVQVGAGVWPLDHAIRLGLVEPDCTPPVEG